MVKAKFSKRARNLVADFRSLPHENHKSSLRIPKQVGFLADIVLKGLSIRNKCEDIILNNWNFIVGTTLCSRCCPITILPNDAILVGCDTGIVRQELESLKPDILERISTLPRCKHIGEIRFKLSENR